MTQERRIEVHSVHGRRGQADIPADFEEAIDAAEKGETTLLLGHGKPIAAIVPEAVLDFYARWAKTPFRELLNAMREASGPQA